MKDVAALAGVSLKTVSRVVNGEGAVAVDLADRVRRAADQLEFKPNRAASALRRRDGKTRTIGLLLEDVSNPFSATVLRAIEDVARTRGVLVLAGSLDEEVETERALALTLVERRVDGLIIVPTGADQSYLQIERRSGMQMVFVDRAPRFLDADAVLSDNRDGARSGCEHLVRGGHRRIAFLGDLRSITTAEDRYQGYLDALRAHGIPTDERIIVHDLRSIDAAQLATKRLFDLEAPPTAIFAGQNLVTMGTIRGLRELELQQRVALVGFDDFLLADLLEPPVTVVAQDPRQIGRVAAELLFARMDGNTDTSRSVIVSTNLIVRGSGEIPPAVH